MFSCDGELRPVHGQAEPRHIYYKSSTVAEMGDRLATIDRKEVGGVAVTLSGGGGSPSNTMWPARRPTSVPSGILIYSAVWPKQIRAENWEVLCPFLGGAETPSNTMWPGPRPTSMPSFILIHSTVWPQYTNVADRQDRHTDR